MFTFFLDFPEDTYAPCIYGSFTRGAYFAIEAGELTKAHAPSWDKNDDEIVPTDTWR